MIAPEGPFTIYEGDPVSFPVQATELDGGAASPLTCSIAPLPAGAVFNAITMQFSWTTTFGQAGDYAVQVRYHNGANQVNLGISGGVKWLAVKDESGAIVAQGVVQLPHARIEKAHTPIVYSTPLAAALQAGRSYRIEMSDFFNMSYLQSNSSFSAAGGVEGPSNRFDIYGVRLLRVR